jgi:XisI protein
MEKSEIYQNKIKELISKYASYQYTYGDIFDTEHDHYQLVRIGWEGKKRVDGCAMHFDIKDNKIWIQCNFTDVDIAQELMDLGIPREDHRSRISSRLSPTLYGLRSGLVFKVIPI